MDNKYDNIKLYAHPMSGVDQVYKVLHNNISTNIEIPLIDNETYKFAFELDINSNTLYVYIERRFRDLIKSLYEVKHKFGIDDIEFEKFYTNRYSNICSINSKNDLFKCSNMSPRTYWEHHINSWIRVCKENGNAIIISYDRCSRDNKYCIERVKNA